MKKKALCRPVKALCRLHEDLIEDYKDYVKVKSIESEIGASQWQIFQNLKTVQQMVGAPQARMPIFVVKQP